MIIIEKSIHHLFHPFTSYENSNHKLSFIQGVAALAVGYYTASLAAAGRLSPRMTYYYPYLTGITVFYLFTAILKIDMPKYQPPPPVQHNPPPIAAPIPPKPQPPAPAPQKPQPPPPPPPKNVLMDWKTTLKELTDYYDTLSDNSTQGVQEFEDIRNEELGKRLQEAVKKQLLIGAHRSLKGKIAFLHIGMQYDKDLNDKLLEIISNYHPYDSTAKEFKEHCTKSSQGKKLLTSEGLVFALILCGFLKTNKPLKDVPNMKGCVNSETYFSKKPVDFIPTSQFAIFKEDDFGLEKEEFDSFKNLGEYIELKTPLQKTDLDLLYKIQEINLYNLINKLTRKKRINSIKSERNFKKLYQSNGLQSKSNNRTDLLRPLPQYLRGQKLSDEDKEFAIII